MEGNSADIPINKLLKEAIPVIFCQDRSCRVIDYIDGSNIIMHFHDIPQRDVSQDGYFKYVNPVVLFDVGNLIRFTYCIASSRSPVFVRKDIKAFCFTGHSYGITIHSLLAQLSNLLSYNSNGYNCEDSITIDDDFKKRAIFNLMQCSVKKENAEVGFYSLQEGATLKSGRYTIKKVLGSGGFAITYLATDNFWQGKEIVIKELFMQDICSRDPQTLNIITSNLDDNTQIKNTAIAKFIGEAEKIKDIEHPNIVKVYDTFAEHNTYYYTMEYLPNGSLDDLLVNGAIPEERAIKYIKGVASGLAKMHSMNMIHLDIKPSNIMLNNNDEAVIIDFGSTKRYDSLGVECTGNPLVLSNRYAAPELFSNKSLTHFSPKADVYSLGATLFAMLTKRLPVDYRRTRGMSSATKNAIKAATAKFDYRTASVEEFMELLQNSHCTDIV